jgi:hypothetical protein
VGVGILPESLTMSKNDGDTADRPISSKVHVVQLAPGRGDARANSGTVNRWRGRREESELAGIRYVL